MLDLRPPPFLQYLLALRTLLSSQYPDPLDTRGTLQTAITPRMGSIIDNKSGSGRRCIRIPKMPARNPHSSSSTIGTTRFPRLSVP